MSVRLFVLGLIYGRDIHGYEIKEIAKLWGLDRWAKIGFGSIYHALGKLHEERLIEERGVEQEGNRPVRYVYRITDAGKTTFLDLLRQTARSADVETREIDLALAFIHHLPPDERAPLLRERQAMLIPRRQSLENALEEYAKARATTDPHWAEQRRILTEAPWVEIGVKHSLGRVLFEMEWMEKVLQTVTDWPSA